MMSPNSRNTTQVVITILDINDNRPYFPQQQYNICVNETTPVGVIVSTIAAIDLDEVMTTPSYCMVLSSASRLIMLI